MESLAIGTRCPNLTGLRTPEDSGLSWSGCTARHGQIQLLAALEESGLVSPCFLAQVRRAVRSAVAGSSMEQLFLLKPTDN